MNLNSMVDELILIKVAEEDQRKAWKFPSKAEWLQALKGAAIYGAGMGLGAAGGYALKHKVLTKALPRMNDNALNALSFGSSAVAGLVGTAAFKRYLKLIEEKRDKG
jgi:hypothetical protein